MELTPGVTLYALNPKYRDGTRLRAGPAAEAAFNGVWAPSGRFPGHIRITIGLEMSRVVDALVDAMRELDLLEPQTPEEPVPR